jgi:hypothetical protein
MPQLLNYAREAQHVKLRSSEREIDVQRRGEKYTTQKKATKQQSVFFLLL